MFIEPSPRPPSTQCIECLVVYIVHIKAVRGRSALTHLKLRPIVLYLAETAFLKVIPMVEQISIVIAPGDGQTHFPKSPTKNGESESWYHSDIFWRANKWQTRQTLSLFLSLSSNRETDLNIHDIQVHELNGGARQGLFSLKMKPFVAVYAWHFEACWLSLIIKRQLQNRG